MHCIQQEAQIMISHTRSVVVLFRKFLGTNVHIKANIVNVKESRWWVENENQNSLIEVLLTTAKTQAVNKSVETESTATRIMSICRGGKKEVEVEESQCLNF
jgi:hypothetical protein